MQKRFMPSVCWHYMSMYMYGHGAEIFSMLYVVLILTLLCKVNIMYFDEPSKYYDVNINT
jgi:hypothetical protein